MLVGRCGFVLGLQYLNRELNSEIVSQEEMSKLGRVMMKSGRKYAKEHKLNIPLMYQYHGREYLGETS
jgi:hypothetical protein